METENKGRLATEIIKSNNEFLASKFGESGPRPISSLDDMISLGLASDDKTLTPEGERFKALVESGFINKDGSLAIKGEAFMTPKEDILGMAKFDLLRQQVDYNDPESKRALELFKLREESGIDKPDVETTIAEDALNLLKGANQMRLALGTILAPPEMIGGADVSSEEQKATLMAIAQGAKDAPLEFIGGVGGLVHKFITGPANIATGTPKEQVEAKQNQIDFTNAVRKYVNDQASIPAVIDAITDTTAASKIVETARENPDFKATEAGAEALGGMASDPFNVTLMGAGSLFKVVKGAKTAKAMEGATESIANATRTLENISEVSGQLTARATTLQTEIGALSKSAEDLLTIGKADEAQNLLKQAADKTAELESTSTRLAKLDEGWQVNQTALAAAQGKLDEIIARPGAGQVIKGNAVKLVADATDSLGNATGWAAKGIKGIERRLGFHKIPWLVKVVAGIPYGKAAAAYYGVRAGVVHGAPLLKKMAQFGRTVSEELLAAKQTMPVWQRVAANQNTGNLGRAMAGLMHATTPIRKTVTAPIKGAAQVLPATALYEAINSNGLDEAAIQRAGAAAIVFGPLARLAGNSNDWRKASVGDRVVFRQKLNPVKLQEFDSIPSMQVKQFVASFDAAYPNMYEYNFTKSGNSFFDPDSMTVTINVNDKPGMVKALAGHEINHALQYLHQSDSAVISKMLGTEGKAGLVRDTKGNLDPEFKAWGEEYNARMKGQGLQEKSIEDLAIEYYTDVGAQTLFEDVVSGQVFKTAQKTKVRRRIEDMFNKTMAVTPIVSELHFKLGGAVDGNGRMIMGSGLLADGIRELPQVKAMVRNMYRESAGLPNKRINPNDPFSKSSNPNHHKAGEAIRKLNEESVKNKTPLVEGVLNPDSKGNGTGRIPSDYFAKLEELGIIPEGSWGRAVDINENIDVGVGYLLDYRPVAQGRSKQIDGRTTNYVKPIGWLLNEGRLYAVAMDLRQLETNITKAANSNIAKRLKMSREDIIKDIDAVAELHAKNKSTDDYFKSADPKNWKTRKNFINATQGLMTEGQLAKNPMFDKLGQTKQSGIYRTFAFDLIDDAVRMNGESVTGYGPNSYYTLKQNLMPRLPNVNRNGQIIPDADNARFMPKKATVSIRTPSTAPEKLASRQAKQSRLSGVPISALISGASSRQMAREEELKKASSVKK